MSLIGKTLARRYKVLSLLGKGGMGTVYEAEQVDLRRRVAIKVLSANAEPEEMLRFKQEALAAASLAHPNIVQVFDFIEGEEPLLVMELLRGRSLAALVKASGKLEPARAVSMMTQVLSALAAAHDARIVHRDVKPENIFVCDTARFSELVKVLDFGLARPLDEVHHIARTRVGVALGTPAYMAPEQARGAEADVRMDVFAAGVTLYYALSGRRPFEGKTTSELLHAVRRQPPIPLDALCPDLDLEIVRIVERALSKEPSARFASANAFLEALVPHWPAAPRAGAPKDPPVSKASTHGTTAGGRNKRRAPERRIEVGDFEARSPTIAIGMAAIARFAPDGASALAIGPSGLARWTLENGWSARTLPHGVSSADVRGIAFGPKDRGAEAILFTESAAWVRKHGVFSSLEVPAGMIIEGVHVDDASHVVFTGKLEDDAALAECAPNGASIHAIGHGMTMRAVVRAASGALVACGERGTVCILEGGSVLHAHATGRYTLHAVVGVGDGFVAVGEQGTIVYAPAATSDALAKATEARFVDDDLTRASALGKLVCAAGRRVHVAAVTELGRPYSLSAPGIIRDACLVEGAVRVLLDSAAILDASVAL